MDGSLGFEDVTEKEAIPCLRRQTDNLVVLLATNGSLRHCQKLIQKNISSDNVRHSRKDQSSLIRILRVYCDLSPVNVHRTVEEESVERFKLKNLGLGEIAGYVEPYFSG